METISENKNGAKQSRFLKWALVIGIVIVFNLLVNYAVSLVYKAPESPYMTQAQVVDNYTTKEDCLAVGGQWSDQRSVPTKMTPPAPAQEVTGYCDPYFTKNKEFEAAQKVYQRNVFIILVVAGVLALVASAFLPLEVLVLGFSWGGVISLVIASVRYWSTADNLIKVLILAGALGALIWVAIKKFRD